LPQLAHKALIIQDVKDAVAAGKIVTISQSTISYKGWTGAGYSIVDPNTGAGAYLIGGGADGAICKIVGLLYGATLVEALYFADIAIETKNAATYLAISAAIIILVESIIVIYAAYKNIYGDNAADCFGLGIAMMLGLQQGMPLVHDVFSYKNKMINSLIYFLGLAGLYLGYSSIKSGVCD
jgi:hypothetical protein